MKNVIGQHKTVAFLNPEDIKYIGWTTATAKNLYCGEEPPMVFTEPRPEQPTSRSSSRYSTWHASVDDNPDTQIYDNKIKIWEERKRAWEQSVDRYTNRERFLDNEMLLIEGIIDSTVTFDFSRKFEDGFRAENKIKLLLRIARPDDEVLAQQLEQQYKHVMKSFPKAKTLDRTIDSWLRQWQIMIGNQFDQEGDQVRGKKWLSDLAQKVLDISDKVVPRSPRNVALVDSVLQKVRDAQQFESDKQQQEGDRKRTRGEAFANFDVTGGPADEHRSKRQNNSRPPRVRFTRRCEACELPGHRLEDCWYLFPSKRPAGFLTTESFREGEARAAKHVDGSPALAERVQVASKPKVATD